MFIKFSMRTMTIIEMIKTTDKVQSIYLVPCARTLRLPFSCPPFLLSPIMVGSFRGWAYLKQLVLNTS